MYQQFTDTVCGAYDVLILSRAFTTRQKNGHIFVSCLNHFRRFQLSHTAFTSMFGVSTTKGSQDVENPCGIHENPYQIFIMNILSWKFKHCSSNDNTCSSQLLSQHTDIFTLSNNWSKFGSTTSSCMHEFSQRAVRKDLGNRSEVWNYETIVQGSYPKCSNL